MYTRKAVKLACGTCLALAAAPAAAHAVAIEPLKKCYVSVDSTVREPMQIAASGFTPGAKVDVAVNGNPDLGAAGVVTDAGGRIAGAVKAPYQEKGDKAFTVTVTEQGNPANTISTTSRVTALNMSIAPRRSRPGKRVKHTARGFTGGGKVYAHYVFKSKVRKTVSLGKPKGTCGQLTKRAKQIPVSGGVATGTWTVQFDHKKKYSKSPDSVFVRVRILVSRSLR